MTESNLVYDTTSSSMLLSHRVKMDNRDCARLIDYYRIKIGKSSLLRIIKINQRDLIKRK